MNAVFLIPISIPPRWLREHKGLHIYVEPRVKSELLTESDYYNFVHTWKDGEYEWLLLCNSKRIVLTRFVMFKYGLDCIFEL